MDNNDKRIAVLIDADNVSPKYIKAVLDEIANHGIPTYKRIYGDWTRPQMSTWKEVSLEYSISPIQQYSHTTGKNSTDSALIIDAMDILYSQNVDGFCIVSSDSDFTRLAARLREAGMLVLGMGEKKTPRPFVVACEKFKYLEALLSGSAGDGDAAADTETSVKGGDDLRDLIVSIQTIVTDISDEEGWASLGGVGNMLNKRFPDFDTRNYGFSKLTNLVKSLNAFDIESRKIGNTPHASQTFIRNRQLPKKKPTSRGGRGRSRYAAKDTGEQDTD
ncbi:MAG: NYN domain-containing protein [Syntrophomonadaceae bacterium]|nr:NYN domain-containing protein [Syntrophomonadaceae bacterium]